MDARLEKIPSWALLSAAAAVFVALSLWEMSDESVTTDEIVHLTAAHTYLSSGDFRLNTEHPNLTKLLAALPLRALDLKEPTSDRHWVRGQQWQHAFLFFHQSGNDADRLLFWGRLPMLFWSLLLLGAVYALSRDLFGPTGGLVSLALATFSPMMLGHGHLVTTDVPVAALLLLVAAALRRLVEAPSAGRALAAGVLWGGALATKYNAVLLLPAFAWYLLTQLMQKDARPPRLWTRRDVGRWAGYLGLIAGASALVIWAVYRFRYAASPDPGFALDWSFERTRESAVGRALDLARRRHLLPEAWLHGFAFMFENAQARTAFALGELSPTGWWWYFPFAYLVKTPVSALLLTGAGFAAAFRPERAARTSFLSIPLIIYGVVAMGSNINIGLRHVFPVLPLLFVLAGGLPYDALLSSPRRLLRGAVAAVLVLIPVETLAGAPYFLAYFNAPSTLFAARHDLLADSNLDWGQDLRRLKRWMDREGVYSILLGYFGNASPRACGLRHVRLVAANMYQDFEPEWTLTEEPKAGDWVAVSATNYTGIVLGPRAGHYKRLLAGLRPATVIGHSILVYRLPDGWKAP